MQKTISGIILLAGFLCLVLLIAVSFPGGFGEANDMRQEETVVWTMPELPVPDPKEPIRSEYEPGEITRLCESAFASANASLDAIADTPPEMRTVDNTLIRFENTMGDLSDATGPLILMGYVSPDPEIAEEGSACEERTAIFSTQIYTRRDLYDAIRGQTPRNADEARLYNKTIEKFEKNGLMLPDDRLAHVREMREDLSTLENQFSTNLNNDNSSLEFTAEELAGVPDGVLATFRKTDRDTYLVTTKSPDYIAVMQNADNDETRRRMHAAYVNRQAEENTRLLEEAILLRQQIAHELGYDTWADYQTDGRMAENKENVAKFLSALKEPVQEKTGQETAELLAVKKEYDPRATSVDAWDILYLQENLRRERYSLDDETVRQYFPLDSVMGGMFDQYSDLLGIRIAEVKDAKVWAEGVQLYRIDNATSGDTIAYFYTDLFPREGKYGHMAMFGLVAGWAGPNDSYNIPVGAIVGNVRAPDGEKLSLLSQSDIEDVFHEFGHTLHWCLTRAPYATLSGYNVEMDFVEAPSQALEEWAWQPDVLREISGLYTDPTQKIPDDLLESMIEARDMDMGLTYSRMLRISCEDMEYHTADGPVNVTELSDVLYEEMMGIPSIEDDHEPATIGHFMGGYDAGYYSYLWSKVYALNIYDRFARDGLRNTTTGREYLYVDSRTGEHAGRRRSAERFSWKGAGLGRIV